jgi:Ca2+/H+ antiporter, TMEM165/GDT1 family
MSSVILVTIVSTFIASAVEMVEAVTIVLAVGVTRQWRSALLGVGTALLTLSVLVGIFGTAIVVFLPLDVLRLVIGSLLLIYGLQWLTKAILRAGGAKAKHDETAIYGEEIAALRAEQPVPATGIDWISFTVAFKGVLLEGLEVAFIVITFGASAGALPSAALGAALAALVVLAIAVVIRKPLAGVPENGLKFVVGVMLVTFGTFWAGEGLGVEWPIGDLTLFGLLAGYVALGLAGTWFVQQRILARRARGQATGQPVVVAEQ